MPYYFGLDFVWVPGSTLRVGAAVVSSVLLTDAPGWGGSRFAGKLEVYLYNDGSPPTITETVEVEPSGVQTCCLQTNPDGAIDLTYLHATTNTDLAPYYRRSEDGGKTWSDRELLPGLPFSQWFASDTVFTFPWFFVSHISHTWHPPTGTMGMTENLIKSGVSSIGNSLGYWRDDADAWQHVTGFGSVNTAMMPDGSRVFTHWGTRDEIRRYGNNRRGTNTAVILGGAVMGVSQYWRNLLWEQNNRGQGILLAHSQVNTTSPGRWIQATGTLGTGAVPNVWTFLPVSTKPLALETYHQFGYAAGYARLRLRDDGAFVFYAIPTSGTPTFYVCEQIKKDGSNSWVAE